MLLSLPGTMGCGKWFLMASSEAGSALARVWQGHALLAACAALYLVWWVLFFRPEGSKPAGALYTFGVACILGASPCGLAGVFGATAALGELPQAGSVPGWAFALGGVAGYLVLLALTAGVFHRQVTTELLLIDAWGAFELCVVASLTAAGALGSAAVPAMYALVGVLVVVSLACYVLYYRLGPAASFVDGMVPLVAVGVVSVVLVALLLR